MCILVEPIFVQFYLFYLISTFNFEFKRQDGVLAYKPICWIWNLRCKFYFIYNYIFFNFIFHICSQYYSPELNALTYMSYVTWDCWIMHLWCSAPHSLSYSCCYAPSLQPVRFPSFCCSYLPHRTAAFTTFTAPHNIILHSTHIHNFKRAKSHILMTCHPIHTKHLHLTKTRSIIYLL